MKSIATRWVTALALVLALALGGIGCGDDGVGEGPGGNAGDGGSAGSGGGGTGGSAAQKIELPECALNGYEDLQALWSSTENILRYMHHTQPLDPSIAQRRADFPALTDLPPIEELGDPTIKKPRVLWATFTWTPETTADRPERTIRAHVYQGLDEGIYGVDDVRSFSIEQGLYQGRVAVLDWHIDERAVGAGTFSVVGLGPVTVPPARTYYAARATIIAFPECVVPDTPKGASMLCSDPIVPDTSNDNPWFEDGGCRFELTSFSLHLNLSSALAEPTSVLIGFEVEVGGIALENGSITVGTDGTTNITATYGGEPVSVAVNFSTGELTLKFTGEPVQACSYDTVSGKITDCAPTT
ncbi:MAG: hypothetical protein E4H00_01550 [Myxococcales bacterium]|nr:MAG: hypothetical protein E4H00_01550 [Myxococcales bacterium]